MAASSQEQATAKQSTLMEGDGVTTKSAAPSPRLYDFECTPTQWPILYKDSYNISFFHLEKIHPFDAGKWGKVHSRLVCMGMLKSNKSDVITPKEINEQELLQIHTQEYLNSLKSSYNVALITEVAPVAILPNFFLQRRLLTPFREQTGGTVMAGKLARDRGWAINIGGGFHHCSSGEGGGFCAYADISLCVKFMFDHLDNICKVLVLDLDAHQGNGYERDLGKDRRVFITDIYNRWIYPNDREAKKYIDKKIELDLHTEDKVYIGAVELALNEVLDDFAPDIVVYNAGTDVLKGDPLGLLDVTDEGVIQRDEIVFTEVKKKRGIPILMLTSGGYQRNNATIIADSIKNLHDKGLISGPE